MLLWGKGYDYGVQRHFQRSFSYIVAVSFIGRGNRNSHIKEEQTKQWPKEKVQKDKQRSTIHTHKTKDRVTRIPLKTCYSHAYAVILPLLLFPVYLLCIT
jgi:hypothetical protein